MLTDLQTMKLTRYFRVYDIDDDGFIESSDFERIVENVRLLHGVEGNGPDALRDAYTTFWHRLQATADSDGDLTVDLDEWLAYWQRALEDDARYEAEVEAITTRLLSIFDLDESGAIGRAEFRDFYGIFGLAVSLADTVFETLDLDGDGAISRDELLALSRQFFRGNDVEEPGNLLFGPYGA
jgi:Ca2+-binding EF-hand superfamily protein